MKRKLTAILIISLCFSTISMLVPKAKATVYNYSITDITQTASDTVVVTAQCLFCSACNPNDPGSLDRGQGCTPFGCGFPPASFPSYVPCQQGSPDGRYAAIRLKGSFGSVVQKLVCDQSNWPLETLWSHNFVFNGLVLQSGETITIEADFYCSYCYHWYATPQTFVPNQYTIVFVPLNWQGTLGAFNTEAQAQADFLIDNVGILTDDNTEVTMVGESLTLNFDKTATGWRTFNGWTDISQFAINHGATGDRYVAITDEDIWGSVEGLSNGGMVVVVEQGATHVTAHELGHSWGLLDEYYYQYWLNQAQNRYNYPTGFPPNSYPGDDGPPIPAGWSYGRAFDSHRCIMGSADTVDFNNQPIDREFCPAHTKDEGGTVGVRNYVGCAAHADTAIQQEWATSSAGLISIIVTFYRSGATPNVGEIQGIPVYGKPQLYLGPSGYSVQVYAEEHLIYDSNVTVGFWLLPSQPVGADQEPIQVDTMTVQWLAPAFSEPEVNIELRDNVKNEVIASQVVSIGPIADAWIDYATTDKGTYDFGETIQATTEISTIHASMNVVLDVSLLDSNNIAQDYRSWTGTIYPFADPITLYLNIPSSGTAGTWTVYVAILNSAGQLQDSKENSITIGDDDPPSLTIEVPAQDEALQDGVTFSVSASDASGVQSVDFSIQCAQGNVISPEFEDMPGTHMPDCKWKLYFDTTRLPDGYYLLVANGTDVLGNWGITTVPFCIRNWAATELLPASERNKAGRTTPVKFSLRIVAAVDPAQPFIRNEELTIRIYAKGDAGNILQTSTYGATARDYRISSAEEHYITNFQTLKTPQTYVVEIYRKGMLIGTFEFKTAK